MDEISKRIGTLQLRYADNSLVERIDHHIAPDWSGEPAIFLNVILTPVSRDAASLKSLANDLRLDVLRVVHAEDVGLHSYLNFVSRN